MEQPQNGSIPVGVLRREAFGLSESDLVAEVLGVFNVTSIARAAREGVRAAITRAVEEGRIRIDFTGQYFAP